MIIYPFRKTTRVLAPLGRHHARHLMVIRAGSLSERPRIYRGAAYTDLPLSITENCHDLHCPI